MHKINSWQSLALNPVPSNTGNGKLLIETSDSLITMHQLCMYAYIVCQAKKISPTFLCSENKKEILSGIISKYFTSFDLISYPPSGKLKKIKHFIQAGITWLGLLLRRNLIELQQSGFQIGDIIYDQYLASRHQATLHYWDPYLAWLSFKISLALSDSLNILKKTKAQAVLLSHKVGFTCAPLAWSAEKLGLSIYSFGAGYYGALLRSNKRKEYEYYASKENMSALLVLPNKKINELFEQVKEHLFAGLVHADAKRAYARKLYTDRDEFISTHNLRADRKNVFIMLHAFTDYPHSHFNGMLFNDYYDWFIKTLCHALKNDTVNWIVKEHPSSHLYPAHDINWMRIKQKFSAPHIIFMEPNSAFNSLSIIHVGDAVITCIGSAGFELSALGGIPSITAGDNPYATAGFATTPTTRDDYFKALWGLERIEHLNDEKHRMAKAAFIYIHRASRVEMMAIPHLSETEHRELQFNPEYFDRLEKHIQGKEAIIKNQLGEYIEEVSRPEFQLLTDMENFFE